jgi:hypothetical protein
VYRKGIEENALRRHHERGRSFKRASRDRMMPIAVSEAGLIGWQPQAPTRSGAAGLLGDGVPGNGDLPVVRGQPSPRPSVLRLPPGECRLFTRFSRERGHSPCGASGKGPSLCHGNESDAVRARGLGKCGAGGRIGPGSWELGRRTEYARSHPP